MKKILSVLLSLTLIFSAMSILAGIGFTASAATTDNLLTNPQFASTDGTISGVTGWNISDGAELVEGEDGYNTIVISTTDTDGRYAVSNQGNLWLSTTKYYKFSVMAKLEDPVSGDFNIDNEVYLTYKYSNQAYVNRVLIEKTSEWKEYSFIMYGGDVSSGAWDLFYSVVSNYSRCKLSIKQPSVTVVDTDALNYKDDIVTENLLPETFDKFKYSTTAAWYSNADTETVDLNGEEVTAFKLTRKNTNDNYAVYFALDNDDGGADYKLNLASKLDTSKTYLFSAWIKLDNADVYDEATGSWVAGDSYEYNQWASNYGASAYFMNGSNTYYSERVTTFGEWVKVSYVLNEDSYSSWRCRLGINTCAIGCNVYVADVRLEEFAGDISDNNPQSVLPENFDKFKYATTAACYANADTETVDLNGEEVTAFKLTRKNTDNEHYAVYFALDNDDGGADYKLNLASKLDTSKTYLFSAWVKLDNADVYDEATGNWVAGDSYDYNQWLSSYGASAYFMNGSNTYYSERVTTFGEWVKVSYVLDEESYSNWRCRVGIDTCAIGCNVYVADVQLTEITGGTIELNRANAVAGDVVEILPHCDYGYTLDRLYYTDGTNEVEITDKRATVVNENLVNSTHKGHTYTSLASDLIYTFVMPTGVDVTVMAEFKQYLFGDVNGDFEVDARDIVRLKKFLAGLSVEVVAENLDTTTEELNIYHLAVVRGIFLGEIIEEDVATTENIEVANVDSLTTLTENFQ